MLTHQYNVLKHITVFIFIMFSIHTPAQIIEPKTVYKTSSFGFSQAIVYNGLVYTSGQVGWDVDHKLTGNGSFEDQATQCFKNLDLLLDEANSAFAACIHLRLFVTDISDRNKKIIATLMKSYFPGKHQPTSTLLCVKALARDELMIEIEAIAPLIKTK